MEEIDLKKCFKLFNTYVKKFDFKENNIMRKFHHTYRVVEYAKEIAISQNLKEEDINLACLCALLHDIGRFEQWTKYQTYFDLKSIDHANLGYEILKKDNYIEEYIKNYEAINVVLKSVLNHNKYNIDENLTNKEELFCKIIRDADKIDIMIEQGNMIKQNNLKLNDNALNSLFKNKLCDNSDIKNEADHILRILGFIFDFNFKYTYRIIQDKKIVNDKINLLKRYVDDNKLNELGVHLNEYIERVIKC